ncbi:hypothetical protein BYT27DRAFT_7181519, partial [Phlegmacium glaucopus]
MNRRRLLPQLPILRTRVNSTYDDKEATATKGEATNAVNSFKKKKKATKIIFVSQMALSTAALNEIIYSKLFFGQRSRPLVQK